MTPPDTSIPIRQRGFSLVELMIVLVMVAALLGIGVPLFETFIQDQRMRATSSDLRVALSTARSEAVKRNRLVGLEPGGEDDDWADGWTIPDPDDPVNNPPLFNHVQPGKVSIDGPDEVEFSPMGRVAAAEEFEIQVGDDDAGHILCLKVGTDGRVTSEKGECE